MNIFNAIEGYGLLSGLILAGYALFGHHSFSRGHGPKNATALKWKPIAYLYGSTRYPNRTFMLLFKKGAKAHYTEPAPAEGNPRALGCFWVAQQRKKATTSTPGKYLFQFSHRSKETNCHDMHCAGLGIQDIEIIHSHDLLTLYPPRRSCTLPAYLAVPTLPLR